MITISISYVSPPHTSHAMQPLDVACFRPAKATWSDIVINFYLKNRSESITKAHFPSLLKLIMEHLVARPNLAVAGFMGAGIRPLNRDVVKKKIITPGKNRYISHIDSDKNNNYMNMTAKEHRAAICKVLNAFLEDRFPKVDSIPARVRRRRVQAAEGEILTSEESLARLLEEEQARALAPKRPRGRPKGSGAALAAPTDAVQSGPIDKYVSKTPPQKEIR